jgi:hypothetical protein
MILFFGKYLKQCSAHEKFKTSNLKRKVTGSLGEDREGNLLFLVICTQPSTRAFLATAARD